MPPAPRWRRLSGAATSRRGRRWRRCGRYSSGSSTTSSPRRRRWSTPSEGGSMDEPMRAPLQQWLAERQERRVDLVDLRRIATGNSRANWYAETAEGARYVVRVEQGGVFGSSSADEFRMMQAAHELGCRVAPVRWIEPTGAVLGQPFFVMDY